MSAVPRPGGPSPHELRKSFGKRWTSFWVIVLHQAWGLVLYLHNFIQSSWKVKVKCGVHFIEWESHASERKTSEGYKVTWCIRSLLVNFCRQSCDKTPDQSHFGRENLCWLTIEGAVCDSGESMVAGAALPPQSGSWERWTPVLSLPFLFSRRLQTKG